MGIVILSIIGLLAIISIIGVIIFLTRKKPFDGKNKAIVTIIGVLQAVHILLYFSFALVKMVEANVYIAFVICAALSLVCLILSFWLTLPFSKYKNAIKYLFMFLAIMQVFITVVIFLLPEGGIEPLIRF